MVKVLLLDTSFSARPIYDFLYQEGLEVYVAGANPNDALAKSARNYINIDYSDINEVKKIIQKNDFDYLVPGGNDLSYKICSEINDWQPFYNIDPLKINNIINNKKKFREFASKINLHVPKHLEETDVSEESPVIVKPVDGFSGHGITVLEKPDKKSLAKAVKDSVANSREQDYVIEEFVQGQLYSHSAFIRNKKIFIDFVVEEHCIVNEFVVDTSSVAGDFNEKLLQDIRADIIKLAVKLNLNDGLIHTQFIADNNNFWIIEMTRRCPGDLYSKLVEYSTDVSYAALYASPFINKDFPVLQEKLINKYILRHTVTVGKERVYNMLKWNESLTPLNFVPLSLTGDNIKESPLSRIGVLFLTAKSSKELNSLLSKSINRTLYSIE